MGITQTEDYLCHGCRSRERVHHSLLAQVEDYANCNLFSGQEARRTILHCMQSRLVSVAGSFQSVQGQLQGLSSPEVPGNKLQIQLTLVEK